MQAVHQKQKIGHAGYVPLISLRSRIDDNNISLHVCDNGPGVPDALKERIYEPFFTTKEAGAGTGLGLSIVHDIITNGHGGSLKVLDVPGGGAEFIVMLPIPPAANSR
jgi:signal transduction histidine kinase